MAATPPQEAEALIVDLDLACCYYKPYLGQKNLGQKNYLTIGKNFSSPTKPDQPGISSFIHLEVRALQRQRSWWWL